jgi:hypothetical protein
MIARDMLVMLLSLSVAMLGPSAALAGRVWRSTYPSGDLVGAAGLEAVLLGVGARRQHATHGLGCVLASEPMRARRRRRRSRRVGMPSLADASLGFQRVGVRCGV